jgi:protein involved in polysaccharide export with SLBB domain
VSISPNDHVPRVTLAALEREAEALGDAIAAAKGCTRADGAREAARLIEKLRQRIAVDGLTRLWHDDYA